MGKNALCTALLLLAIAPLSYAGKKHAYPLKVTVTSSKRAMVPQHVSAWRRAIIGGIQGGAAAQKEHDQNPYGGPLNGAVTGASTSPPPTTVTVEGTVTTARIGNTVYTLASHYLVAPDTYKARWQGKHLVLSEFSRGKHGKLQHGEAKFTVLSEHPVGSPPIGAVTGANAVQQPESGAKTTDENSSAASETHTGCGIAPLTPIPPIGCKKLKAVCICAEGGKCHWEFVCIPD